MMFPIESLVRSTAACCATMVACCITFAFAAINAMIANGAPHGPIDENVALAAYAALIICDTLLMANDIIRDDTLFDVE